MSKPRIYRASVMDPRDVLVSTLRRLPHPRTGEFTEDWCLFVRPHASRGSWLSLRLVASTCFAEFKAAYWLGWNLRSHEFARWADRRKLYEGRRALFEFTQRALEKLQSVARFDSANELSGLRDTVNDYLEYLDSEITQPELIPVEWLPQPLKGLDRGVSGEASESPVFANPPSTPRGPHILEMGPEDTEGEHTGDEPPQNENEDLL